MKPRHHHNKHHRSGPRRGKPPVKPREEKDGPQRTPLRQGFGGSGAKSGEAAQQRSRIVGVLAKAANGWRLQSANRRERGEYILHAKTRFTLEAGHLAVAELSAPSRHGPRECKLIEVLGDASSPRAVSLIAIATHDIPQHFSKEALAEAEAAQPVTLGSRTDLRDIPLVTIDGEDARDFDDAVFAEPDGSGGWHLIVAIADVAHYVKAGGALDRDAYERGNSVYFPDRVVPMLPEALSNELCSLKPQVERACMAVHLYLDGAGELMRWQFVRGIMRSKARLTYDQVQHAMDGNPDATTAPLLDPVIKPLYAAYKCLTQARMKRGTLELDLPERKVEMGKDGFVKAIKVRERFDSHKLIEEFMITANVAAAAQLEGKGGTCLYRVHDKPSELKLEGLRDFLNSLGISLVPEASAAFACAYANSRKQRRRPACAGGQRDDAAQPGAGDLQPRQYRPFRPRTRQIRAFHFADPALRRSGRASRPDPRLQAGQ